MTDRRERRQQRFEERRKKYDAVLAFLKDYEEHPEKYPLLSDETLNIIACIDARIMMGDEDSRSMEIAKRVGLWYEDEEDNPTTDA